jgi:hypothetical protein
MSYAGKTFRLKLMLSRPQKKYHPERVKEHGIFKGLTFKYIRHNDSLFQVIRLHVHFFLLILLDGDLAIYQKSNSSNNSCGDLVGPFQI